MKNTEILEFVAKLTEEDVEFLTKSIMVEYLMQTESVVVSVGTLRKFLEMTMDCPADYNPDEKSAIKEMSMVLDNFYEIQERREGYAD